MTRACANARMNAMQLMTPGMAQLAEHLTVDACSNQIVPGSIPGGRISEKQPPRARTRDYKVKALHSTD